MIQTKLIALILLSIPLIANANQECFLKTGKKNDSSSYFGSILCSDVTQEKLSVNGPVTMTDSTFSTVTIIGPTQMAHSTVNNLTVTGTLTSSNDKINQLSLKGVLQAAESKIAKINAVGDMTLTDSAVGNITIISSTAKPNIYLKGKTVTGNITFMGGNGVVYQEKTATIKGKVIGGKVEIKG